jgi:hypothetical protein
VVAELSGEKIDVIPWSDDASLFVANALSPAQVISVDIDEEHRIASVTVPERMLSLAIGREGQNARLAARLTGWRIDIRSDVSVAEARAAADAAAAEEAPRADAGSASEAPAADGQVPAADAVTEEAPAKPKRTVKKAAAPKVETNGSAAVDAETTAADAAPMTAEAPAKPKRTTKAAAKAETNGTGEVEAEATTEAAPSGGSEAPAKPKRTTKKAAAVPSEEVSS